MMSISVFFLTKLRKLVDGRPLRQLHCHPSYSLQQDILKTSGENDRIRQVREHVYLKQCLAIFNVSPLTRSLRCLTFNTACYPPPSGNDEVAALLGFQGGNNASTPDIFAIR